MDDMLSVECGEFEDMGNGVRLRWCMDGRIFYLTGTSDVKINQRDSFDTGIEVLRRINDSWDWNQPQLSIVNLSFMPALDYHAMDSVRQFNLTLPKDKMWGRIGVILPPSRLGRLMHVAVQFALNVGWKHMQIRTFTDETEAYLWVKAGLSEDKPTG